jgi:hypothetical protein
MAAPFVQLRQHKAGSPPDKLRAGDKSVSEAGNGFGLTGIEEKTIKDGGR